MQISSNAVGVLKKYEQGPKGGHARYVYICPAGHPTIGYGHVVLPDEKFVGEMTEAEAHALLMKDAGKFERGVSKAVTVPVTQSQFDAMVLLAFNTGLANFTSSTLLKLVNQSKFQLASGEFGKWVYGTVKGKKVVLNGLVYRRKTEAHLFISGKVTYFN